jgi:hypothetical protein
VLSPRARTVEGNTLEANPKRATGGPSKASSDSAPGIKPLKRTRDARLERTSREPQESRDRETGTDPAGGQSSERASRCAAGRATCRRIAADADRCTDFDQRMTVLVGASTRHAPRRAEAERDKNLKRAIADGRDPRGGLWCRLDRRTDRSEAPPARRSDFGQLAERGNLTERNLPSNAKATSKGR